MYSGRGHRNFFHLPSTPNASCWEKHITLPLSQVAEFLNEKILNESLQAKKKKWYCLTNHMALLLTQKKKSWRAVCQGARVFGKAGLYFAFARSLMSLRLQYRNLCYMSKSAALCTCHWCDTCSTRMFVCWSPRAWTSYSHILRWHSWKAWSSAQFVSWQMAKDLPPPKLQKKGCHF